jgi:hypothetical protein
MFVFSKNCLTLLLFKKPTSINPAPQGKNKFFIF